MDDDVAALYLKDIGKVAFLSHEEEHDLFVAYEKISCLFCMTAMFFQNTDVIWLITLKNIHEDRLRLRTEIMSHYLPFVVSIARSYATRFRISLLDLVQEGNMGLLRAMNSFNHRLGRFITYANGWVRARMNESIPFYKSEMRHCTRFRIYEEGGDEEYPLAEVMVDTQSSLEDRYAEQELEQLMQRQRAIHLEARERKILCMRFGLEGMSDHTLEETGVIFGISRERIRQIEERALRKLTRTW
jgi:RNA polymerase primary sigma factor